MRVDVPQMLLALGITEFRYERAEIWAPCPYHTEKVAGGSWSINNSPESDRYGQHHCFSCDASGGALSLVMDLKSLGDYKDAANWIREQRLAIDETAPLDVEHVTISTAAKPVLKLPRGTRQSPIDTWPTDYRDYCWRRGIGAKQVARWQLGYLDSGYLQRRVLFPAHSHTGKLLNWTARKIDGGEPRYLTPPLDSGPDLSAIFGEAHWPPNTQNETVIVCEGAANGLACERVGAEYIAALGGSNLHPGQLLKLRQFRTVILAVDSDLAGSRIGYQLHSAIARHRNVHKVEFPLGQDPNDIERRSKQALRDLLWG